MKERNILLVGRTGQGKSALANLLVNKNGNFTEVFEEGTGSVSVTKKPQTATFEVDGITYNVIDTPSFSDTDLASEDQKGEEQLLYKLAQIAAGTKGVNQILFVSGGRFTEEEVKVIGGLRSVVFDDKMTDYLTIVRTNFPNFEDLGECKKDWEDLARESMIANNKDKIGSQVVKKIGMAKFIHIDNPSLRSKRAESNKETKELARARLLKHLQGCEDFYEPENLVKLKQKIEDSAEKIEEKKREVQREIEKTKRELEDLKTSKMADELVKTRMINDYSSQLINLSSNWEKLEEEKKDIVTSATRSLLFDPEIVRWSSQAGAEIGRGAIPLLGIGETVGSLVGYGTGMTSYFLNGVSGWLGKSVSGATNLLMGRPQQSDNRQPELPLLRAQISKLQEQLSINQVNIAELVRKNAEKDKRIEDLTKENDSQKKEKDTINEKLEKEREKRADLEEKRTNLVGDNQRLSRERDNAQEESRRERQRNLESDRELNRAQSRIQQLEGQLSQQQQTNPQMQQQNWLLQQEKQSLQNQLTQSNELVRKIQGDIQDLTNKLAVNQTEIATLKGQLSQSESEKGTLKQQIQALEKEKTRLENEKQMLNNIINGSESAVIGQPPRQNNG